MKRIIIVFSLVYGNVPSYIFTKTPGKKNYLVDEKEVEIPSSFGNEIHAITVEDQIVADIIKQNIEQFSRNGYGDIPIEIVDSLTNSKIWNKETDLPDDEDEIDENLDTSDEKEDKIDENLDLPDEEEENKPSEETKSQYSKNKKRRNK